MYSALRLVSMLYNQQFLCVNQYMYLQTFEKMLHALLCAVNETENLRKKFTQKISDDTKETFVDFKFSYQLSVSAGE